MATQDLSFRDKATGYTVVRIDGATAVPSVGGTSVTASLTTTSGLISRGFGATVPADGEAGFSVGCYFINTTGGPGVTAYVNEGTSTSCSFRAISSGMVNVKTVTAIGAAQNSTPTAAQLLGGIVTQSSQTGGGTVTTPIGSALSTAVPGVVVGATFTTLFANIGNQTLTFTAGASGVTIVGTAALPTLKNATLTFVNTGTNTWNVYTQISA